MIWVIAGTLDGRTLAVDIQERTGEEVLVTVVSQILGPETSCS